MAHPLVLAEITTAVGAPSLSPLQGWAPRTHMSGSFCSCPAWARAAERERDNSSPVLPTASYPPLHKAQGRGTLGYVSFRIQWVGHPPIPDFCALCKNLPRACRRGGSDACMSYVITAKSTPILQTSPCPPFAEYGKSEAATVLVTSARYKRPGRPLQLFIV